MDINQRAEEQHFIVTSALAYASADCLQDQKHIQSMHLSCAVGPAIAGNRHAKGGSPDYPWQMSS